MAITLSDEARQYLATFEATTDAQAFDCLIEDDGKTLVFVVVPEDMAAAIGPGGEMVDRLEARFDARIVLVEDADRAPDFVANALAPAAVYDVLVEENGDRVAQVTVDPDDMGVAIGREGERIERARRLAARHFEIDDIELEAGR